MTVQKKPRRRISLKTPASLPGTIYRNGQRYWWKVQLPGEPQAKPRPLKPDGARFATSDPDVAIATASILWEQAVYAENRQKSPPQDTRLVTLVQAYHAYNLTYFCDAHGRVTKEPKKIKYALDFLINFVEETLNAQGHCQRVPYATLLAEDFDVGKLYLLQQAMIAKGLTRNLINKRITMIRRMFKWAAGPQGGQRIPAGIYHSLLTLDGLRKGRCQAKESRQIKAVPKDVVYRVLPYTTPTVAAMIQVQYLTGMRPGELCDLRPCDIDRSRVVADKNRGQEIPVWIYTPTDPQTGEAAHKTAYRGQEREIPIGPAAQEILGPFLLRPAETYCFSPIESEKHRRALLHAQRKTPLSCGNRPGTNRRKNPVRQLKEKYDRHSYYHAVRYAIQAAQKAGVEVPYFHPNQLRHSKATDLRLEKGLQGLEEASATLGHRDIRTTQIYAERNRELALQAAARSG